MFPSLSLLNDKSHIEKECLQAMEAFTGDSFRSKEIETLRQVTTGKHRDGR